MRKVDKLHITADKGAAEPESSSVGPRAWIFPHMTNDTGRCWIIHVISVQEPQIQSLKGLLVSSVPGPLPWVVISGG